MGIGKALAGVDAAPAALQDARLRACRACPHRKRKGVSARLSVSVCGRCGCVLRLKTRIRGESCPDDRWPE